MNITGVPFQVTAGGNIIPSSAVKNSTTADNQVLQAAAATDPIIGIAQPGTRRAPGTGDDDGNAAVSGENIQVYGPGCICPAVLGGTVAAGDILTSDANGRLITTTTDGHRTAAIAMEKGVSQDIITVMVIIGFRTQ